MREPHQWESSRYRLSRFFYKLVASDSGKPIGHNEVIMKKQVKNLQSRRQFFKNVVKTTIPILGAIALANIPLNLTASSVNMECGENSCHNGCQSACIGGCDSTCVAGCDYTCQGGCDGTCKGGCEGACQNSCDGTCYGGCYGSNSSTY